MPVTYFQARLLSIHYLLIVRVQLMFAHERRADCRKEHRAFKKFKSVMYYLFHAFGKYWYYVDRSVVSQKVPVPPLCITVTFEIWNSSGRMSVVKARLKMSVRTWKSRSMTYI